MYIRCKRHIGVMSEKIAVLRIFVVFSDTYITINDTGARGMVWQKLKINMDIWCILFWGNKNFYVKMVL